jgi:hypothetical protein
MKDTRFAKSVRLGRVVLDVGVRLQPAGATFYKARNIR